METIEVNIKLDPLTDGAVIKGAKLKRKDAGALVIATNGESKIVDIEEAQSIIDSLSDVGHGEYIGNTPYIAMFNGDKILHLGTGKCFIGSVIIMKFDGSGLAMLSGDDFEEAAKEFTSRLIRLVGNGQEFSAYEIL